MSKPRDHASPLWDRAEECRALAATAKTRQSRTDYLQLADLYIELAAKEEKVAKRNR